ncbi:DoxX family membrane protein [Candidatus Berkelbacteria bacterium]|nr:DoxX family membrane protein [Candidatus Berkelbacteria bacterium]
MIEANSDLGLYLLRFAVAVIFIAYAFPKLAYTTEHAKKIKLRTFTVVFLGIAEILAAVGLILGLFVQASAAVLAIAAAGTLLHKYDKVDIGLEGPELGWQFDVLLLIATVTILMTGGGNYLTTY